MRSGMQGCKAALQESMDTCVYRCSGGDLMYLQSLKIYLDEAPVRRRLRAALVVVAAGTVAVIWYHALFRHTEDPSDLLTNGHIEACLRAMERTLWLLTATLAAWILIPLAERRA
jgi:hypothetical protein